jgi:hypothetical protein
MLSAGEVPNTSKDNPFDRVLEKYVALAKAGLLDPSTGRARDIFNSDGHGDTGCFQPDGQRPGAASLQHQSTNRVTDRRAAPNRSRSY